MRLPTPLSRRNSKAHKNQFGHILIIAGSPRMLGAAALCGLAGLRGGSGLVTVATAKSLILTLHKKLSPAIMTMPLAETAQLTIASCAFRDLKAELDRFDAIAIGPGLSTQKSTQQFIRKVITRVEKPLVVDADALNAVSEDLSTLKKTLTPKVLTPHPGEMARLTKLSKKSIESDRLKNAKDFSRKHKVILLLKGHRTVISNPEGKTIVNKTVKRIRVCCKCLKAGKVRKI